MKISLYFFGSIWIIILPLLAAILYCPAPYSSEKAHELAAKFINANPMHLQAVALNF